MQRCYYCTCSYLLPESAVLLNDQCCIALHCFPKSNTISSWLGMPTGWVGKQDSSILLNVHHFPQPKNWESGLACYRQLYWHSVMACLVPDQQMSSAKANLPSAHVNVMASSSSLHHACVHLITGVSNRSCCRYTCYLYKANNPNTSRLILWELSEV